MSAIVWLRSAALRMYAAIWVSKATGSGVDAGSSAKRRDEHRLDLVADERRAERCEQAAQGVAASAPSAATTRPSVRRPRAPAACRAAAAGRRPAARRRPPAAPRATARGRRSGRAPRTSIRPGSTIAAARAVGRSSAGSNAPARRGRPIGPVPGRRRSRGRRRPRRNRAELQLAAATAARGAPAAAPAVRAPGDAGRRHVAALGDGAQRSRCAPPAISPAIGGSRSISVRNSYSRKSRTTVSRS